MGQWLGYHTYQSMTKEEKQLDNERVAKNIVKSKVGFFYGLRAGIVLRVLVSGQIAGAQNEFGELENTTYPPFPRSEFPFVEPSGFQWRKLFNMALLTSWTDLLFEAVTEYGLFFSLGLVIGLRFHPYLSKTRLGVWFNSFFSQTY